MSGPRKLTLPDSAALAPGGDARRIAPSAQRNAAPILEQLTRLAPDQGRVLELASGTGQHAAAFAAALPGLIWQPSDANPDALASITAWVDATRLPNLRPPVLLDAGRLDWAASQTGYDLVMTVNLLHLISADEARHVVRGMAEAVRPGGQALIYGPFRRDGQLTSDGDRSFDASLRAQDPAIGYKDVSEIEDWASTAGLHAEDHIEMPANNLLLVYREGA